MAGFADYYNNAMYAAQNPYMGGGSPTKGQIASYAYNSPIAQKALQSGINKGLTAYAPKTATGNISGGFKPMGGAAGAGVGIAGSIAAGYLRPKAEAIEMGNPMHGDIVNQYKRREQGPGSGQLATAVDWGSKGAQFGGPWGAAIGAAAGWAHGTRTKHAESAFSDFLPDDARGAITQAYQKYLGRDPEAGAVEGWMAGQGWKPGDKGVGQQHLFEKLDEIANSPEAQQYSGRINTAPTNNVVNMGGWRPGPIAIPSSFTRTPEGQELADRINRRSRGEAA